jgi:hypothetical protein
MRNKTQPSQRRTKKRTAKIVRPAVSDQTAAVNVDEITQAPDQPATINAGEIPPANAPTVGETTPTTWGEITQAKATEIIAARMRSRDEDRREVEMMSPATAAGVLYQEIRENERRGRDRHKDIKDMLEQIRADNAGTHTRGAPGKPFAEGWQAARDALEGTDGPDGMCSIIDEAAGKAGAKSRVTVDETWLIVFRRELLDLFDQRRELSDTEFRDKGAKKRGVKTSNAKDASRKAISLAAGKNNKSPKRT